MYLSDEIQKTLRSLGKISINEVVKKVGDIFVAINVENTQSRILTNEANLIHSLMNESIKINKEILKGWYGIRREIRKISFF